MGLFGGSKTTTRQTSTQIGAADEGIALGANAVYAPTTTTSSIDNFPQEVADFATAALGLAGQSVAGASGAIQTLGTVATREKTPLTEWLPFAGVAAFGLIAAAWIFKD